jgi:hypothetical protein
MDPFDFVIVSSFTLENAIEAGLLVKVFENRWPELSQGKPIVATAAIFEAFSLAAIREIWNEFVLWRREVMPTLPEEEQMFVAKMNGKPIWVLEDGAAFTILFPEDY